MFEEAAVPQHDIAKTKDRQTSWHILIPAHRIQEESEREPLLSPNELAYGEGESKIGLEENEPVALGEMPEEGGEHQDRLQQDRQIALYSHRLLRRLDTKWM